MLALLLATAVSGCALRAPATGAPSHPKLTPVAAVELETTALDPPAEALRFFDAMAIRIVAGERAQFVAGDNRAGYYEGWTHGYRGGVGYRIGELSLYEDRASFVGGQRLPREAAGSETLYPFGHCVEHARARDCLLLHTGAAALSLRLETDEAAELALMPLWSRAVSGYRIERVEELLLLVPPAPTPEDGHPDWIALSADASFKVELTPTLSTADAAVLEVPAGSGSRRLPGRDAQSALSAGPVTAVLAEAEQGDAVPLRLHRATPGRRLTVHIAYADSREQALQSARALAAEDSWQRQIELQHQRLGRAVLSTPDADFNRALRWAQASAHSFVVQQYGPGIWAGLPWFRDNWGRDTFIALPGTLLVSGRFEEARAVLDAFAARQQRDPTSADYGRVPNRVATNQPTIYNTVDGTPWLLRAGLEYVRYSGDVGFADRLIDLARLYFDGAQRHLDGEGLLRHADADTWMDARVYENGPAWSPRGDRAVEIQALWITALESAAELAEARGQGSEAAHWRAQAQRARSAVLKRFVLGGRVADRLRPDGSADLARRPNALMLISVPWAPILDAQAEARLLRDSVEHLLFPYGIASLEPAHPWFHPRHEALRHGQPELHHKDSAYHNGTVWGWNAGFAITALTRHGQQELAWRLTRELARQILEDGTRGGMSELLDAALGEDGTPVPSGTYAQSWSVAEFARNAWQDYLGVRPDLLRNTLRFVPALPPAWTETQARIPFGASETLGLRVEQQQGTQHWRFNGAAQPARRIELDLLRIDGGRVRVGFALGSAARELVWNGREARLDGAPMEQTEVLGSTQALLQGLDFATPPSADPARYPMTREVDGLRRRILDAAKASESPR
ncbi:glycogen debranching enzyme, putative [Aquimonas voraii]|uniref:Glycogen debranching enzyme, putative n=2 Tax=Aquimonas voraii TaxID=265719 RepID=A0A1G6YXZ4_9GAMM|nr:glycogen debranching enzyme, putative [Aquimonas voraii]